MDKQADHTPEAVAVETVEPTYEAVEEQDPLARPFVASADELSTNFYYTVGKSETFNCQFTVRGNPTLAEIEAHLVAAIGAMKAVVHLGGHAKQVGGGSLPTAQTPAAPAPNGHTAPPPPVASGVPATATPTSLTLRAVRMEVEPQDGGKARVGFFSDGRKYADVYSTKKATEWAAFLSGCGNWQPTAFAQAVEYKLTPAYVVTYHLSDKKNSKGNPYKDIDRVDLEKAA